MDLLSVIIPSRNEIFLEKTIRDLLKNSVESIEIIAVLDGYWPEAEEYVLDDCVNYLHWTKSRGMREAINAGVAISKGKFIMKTDAHCMFKKGFDKVMKDHCKKDWVSVPTRRRLDAENWKLRDVNKPPMNYQYITCPDDERMKGAFGGPSLQGREWTQKNKDPKLAKKEIDDLMTSQGSCWFMHRDYFYFLDLMDEDRYGEFGKEMQEINLKCWLSGGRCIRNKKTWYAHLHKGKKWGRGYHLSSKGFNQSSEAINEWMKGMGVAWNKQTKPLSWLLEKFWPVPMWTEKDLKKLKEKGN